MDPTVCLMAAWRAIRSGDHEAAQVHLNNYTSWRNRDGFEPKWTGGSLQEIHGDELSELLHDALTLDSWSEREAEDF